MAFRSIGENKHLTKFNSATSSDFLDLYDMIVDKEISDGVSKPTHRTFAPSSFKCARINWFRLRGTQPDMIVRPDRELQWSADIGTAIHELIQSRISKALQGDSQWISPAAWLDQGKIDGWNNYTYSIQSKGYESLIEVTKPYPIRFAVDGIICWKGAYYLLEIKTCTYDSFEELADVKPKHLDQIKMYSTLLHLPNALVVYVDRTFGTMKCFEKHITYSANEEVINKMNMILECVETNIPPEPLPKGDELCTRSMCPYFDSCKSWGR